MYKVDLANIDGKGAFPCPQCGVIISPDDCTEDAYSIQGTKVNKRGLEEVVIRCNKCRSQIHLIGFSLLQMFSEKNENEISKKAKVYINHV